MDLVSSDFFEEDEFSGWGGSKTESLNTAWLERLRQQPDPEHSDVDVAVALMDLIHNDLLLFGTSGGESLADEEIRVAIRTLRAVTTRCGEAFKLPFRDHSTWKGYWLKNDGYGSWQARRELLSALFDEATASLEAMQDQSTASTLADSISPRERLGWSAVDTEIGELRRHFREGRTPQDYRGVGNDCVHVLEALSRHIYQPELHTPEGEEDPPVQKTKQRIERYIDERLPGSDNKRLRALARTAIEVAQQVKHSSEPTRIEAGIAADAVILMANMLRRLDDAVP